MKHSRHVDTYKPRWNEPLRIPGLEPHEWAASVVFGLDWRTGKPISAFSENAFVVGFVVGAARAYLLCGPSRRAPPDMAQHAQTAALHSVFAASKKSEYDWQETLKRISKTVERRRGIQAGEAVTAAAFGNDVSPQLAALAHQWLSRQPREWVSCVCGESTGEQLSYALREVLLVEPLAAAQGQ